MRESKQPTPDTDRQDRIAEVREIFEEYGFGNAELLEGWDGIDPEELAALLTESEMQTLRDELEFRVDRSS